MNNINQGKYEAGIYSAKKQIHVVSNNFNKIEDCDGMKCDYMDPEQYLSACERTSTISYNTNQSSRHQLLLKHSAEELDCGCESDQMIACGCGSYDSLHEAPQLAAVHPSEENIHIIADVFRQRVIQEMDMYNECVVNLIKNQREMDKKPKHLYDEMNPNFQISGPSDIKNQEMEESNDSTIDDLSNVEKTELLLQMHSLVNRAFCVLLKVQTS